MARQSAYLRELPPGARLFKAFRPSWPALTVLSLASFPGFAALFSFIASLPQGGHGAFALAAHDNLLPAVVLALGVTPALHELVHGLAFQAFGLSPSYGFKFLYLYLYTTADRQVLPRDAYLLVGAGPFLLLSLLGGLLLLWPAAQSSVILAAVTNASGSMGDLWIVANVLRSPREALIMDLKDGVDVYVTAPAIAAVRGDSL